MREPLTIRRGEGVVNVLIPSATGAMFGARVDVTPEGGLSIVSNQGHGYRSAHRNYARKTFGRPVVCTSRLGFVNLSGVPVVVTEWRPTVRSE